MALRGLLPPPIPPRLSATYEATPATSALAELSTLSSPAFLLSIYLSPKLPIAIPPVNILFATCEPFSAATFATSFAALSSDKPLLTPAASPFSNAASLAIEPAKVEIGPVKSLYESIVAMLSPAFAMSCPSCEGRAAISF